MAALERDHEETRQSWLLYAIALGSRGLWPTSEINVHGPHDATGVWGDASCRDHEGRLREVKFRLEIGEDVSDIHVWDSDDNDDEPAEYEVIPENDLPPKFLRQLETARRSLARIRRQ